MRVICSYLLSRRCCCLLALPDQKASCAKHRGKPGREPWWTRSSEERAKHLVDGLLQAHSHQPGLHRVLIEVSPPSAHRSDGLFDRQYLDAYRKVIAAARGASPDVRLAVPAKLLAGAVEGAIHLGVRSDVASSLRWRRGLVRLVHRFLEDELPH
ncbi:hypothetical protein [Variovorax sp. Sphag1AA]|uniref:hypothetical protein n=1 Tax=Variovorax sp. Sphag1AA TaxID=2587027 RepID=UPI0039082B75